MNTEKEKLSFAFASFALVLLSMLAIVVFYIGNYSTIRELFSHEQTIDTHTRKGNVYSVVNTKIDYSLPTNPVTGFNWVIDEIDKNVVEYKPSNYVATEWISDIGGRKSFHLQAFNPGKHTVIFVYKKDKEVIARYILEINASVK
jgi:predicted secreted protein